MLEFWLINQWSIALFELANELHKTNQFIYEINKLIIIFNNYSQFIKIISSINLNINKRKKILNLVFNKKINIYILNFLFLLVDKNHFQYILLILKKFQKLYNNYKNIKNSIVYSAIKLSKSQIKQIQQKIEKKYQCKINIINKINKSLIGGIKIKFKNQIFDGSIKNQIAILKQKLLIYE